MSMGFFPNESDRMLADAARRAFQGAADAEAAIDGLEVLHPVGAATDLVSAAIVVREAARAGLDYPLVEALVRATVEGQGGRAADLRAGFAAHTDGDRVTGPAQCLLLPETGRTLVLYASPGAQPKDPLQAVTWAQTRMIDATVHEVDTRAIAWTLLAAGILGAGEAMLDATTAYLQQREQFGRKLGSFQSLRHRAASDWVRLEDIRAAVDLAAVTFDAGDAAGALQAARIAKAIASDHGPVVAENAIHAHGAMGFTWEAGLLPHLVVIRHRAAALGGATEHYAALGAALTERPEQEAVA
ncbi:acyl-CoA dehydrogenase family protein [Citreimonas sp.]|uniref:acyl-CoA dehydrogenase family protein n=1 Tax=Citreimonas sp. TaxID=3036715 RepID=UPI004059A334